MLCKVWLVGIYTIKMTNMPKPQWPAANKMLDVKNMFSKRLSIFKFAEKNVSCQAVMLYIVHVTIV